MFVIFLEFSFFILRNEENMQFSLPFAALERNAIREWMSFVQLYTSIVVK